MKEVKSSHVDDSFLDSLLGIESSKIGFYADVKQKIQELEAANLNLHTKKNELQAVFDAISDCVVIYDQAGLIQYRNHLTPRLFPEETLHGKGCRALFHPDRSEDHESCPVGRALRGESCQMSYSINRSLNKNIYLDVSATPIRDPNGRNRALVFIRDVTDRRAQEIQLLQAEKLSSIGVLAAGVAHEINNPITSVAGYAEALLRRFRDSAGLHETPELKDFPNYLEVIVREVYRCKAIIDSLLSFSRKSDGSVDKVDLNQLIYEVLELVRHQGRNKNIELHENLQMPLPMVNGDASSLRQVFLNLIMNAFQAIKDRGTVSVETTVENDQVVARVADNGMGIAPDILDQIWNPFFTTKVVGKGQGLGLAVTYDIIKKHDGHIEVHSQVGEGTEFVLRLAKCQGD
jgi:two-component system, NtrC family, sensor kinase